MRSLYVCIYMERRAKKSPYFLDLESSTGLFDRIILAIKREQELRRTRKLAFGFLALLAVSLLSAPFSWTFFSGQVTSSGILQFVSIAINDFGTFLSLWPDSVLAVAESLPIMGMTILIINMILAVFTLRLFIYLVRNVYLIDVFLWKR